MLVSKTVLDAICILLDTVAFFLVTTDLYGIDRLNKIRDVLQNHRPRYLDDAELISIKTVIGFVLGPIAILFLVFLGTFGIYGVFNGILSFFGVGSIIFTSSSLGMKIFLTWSAFGFSWFGWYFTLKLIQPTFGLPVYILIKAIVKFGADGTFLFLGTALFLLSRIIGFFELFAFK